MQKSKFAVRDRVIEFALEKAEEGPYWDRLTKDKTKQHWLKVDFNKWKDEDDSEDESGGGGGPGGADLEEVRTESWSCAITAYLVTHTNCWNLILLTLAAIYFEPFYFPTTSTVLYNMLIQAT